MIQKMFIIFFVFVNTWLVSDIFASNAKKPLLNVETTESIKDLGNHKDPRYLDALLPDQSLIRDKSIPTSEVPQEVINKSLHWMSTVIKKEWLAGGRSSVYASATQATRLLEVSGATPPIRGWRRPHAARRPPQPPPREERRSELHVPPLPSCG